MDTTKLYRVGAAADAIGVKRPTLYAAVSRGDIPSQLTGCGLVLVTLADVERWAAREYRTGRPRGEQS